MFVRYIFPVDSAHVIDCIQCAVTLDDLIDVEEAVNFCERNYGQQMTQKSTIDAAMDIRLSQLAEAEKNPPTCCKFHRSGGHPGDRHGFEHMSKVYGVSQ
jgi:hypothetical protein